MKKHFFTGLLVLVPLLVTIWVLRWLINGLDTLFLPEFFIPTIDGKKIWGVGAVLTLLVIFLIGLLANNLLGKKILKLWDRFLTHLPIVKSIYFGVKQVSDALFADSQQRKVFEKAVLIKYPHTEAWTIAFLTGKVSEHISPNLTGEFVTVFVPNTPIPTAGFMLIVKKIDIIPLDISINEALSYIVSMGVVFPPRNSSE